MPTFGKRSGGGRRNSDRRAAPLLVVVTTIGKSYVAALVDVSSTGAKISGKDLPEVGTVLDLKIDAVRAFGHVAWKRDSKCGIAFDEAVTLNDVAVLRQKAALVDGYSAEMRAMHDEWSSGKAR